MKVLGIGDNVVDKYEHTKMMYPGGNAVNFSVFARQLGISAGYIGVFGEDRYGEHVKRSLTKLGIDLTHAKTGKGENGYALVTLKDGDRVFLGSNAGGVLKQKGLDLQDSDYEYMRKFDLIHTSIYSYSLEEVKKIHPYVDVSYDFSDKFTQEIIEKVFPYIQFASFSCSHLRLEEILNVIEFAKEKGQASILCTRGSAEAIFFCQGRYYLQEAKFVKPVDTMGAGDAFLTFLFLHLKRAKIMSPALIRDALKKAADFAAQQCLVEGSFGFGIAY